MFDGFVEKITPFSVSGWARADEGGAAYVVAEHHGRILGVARADGAVRDINASGEPRGAFLIVFSRHVPPSELRAIQVRRLSAAGTAIPLTAAYVELRDVVQAFVLGSPRSGTSELAATLSAQLNLPWLGESYFGPELSAAEAFMTGEAASEEGLARALAEERMAELVRAATRRIYYRAHAGSSFVDKTPGLAMIRAAPFLQRCFPDARFIFMRRNGVANVLSRMEKFGGDFAAHCQDWAASMEAWETVRPQLTCWLEVEQETMMSDPLEVAVALADFLGRPQAVDAIAMSLNEGARERTGAGLGKRVIADADWSPIEITQFRTYCGEVMHRWGYPLD